MQTANAETSFRSDQYDSAYPDGMEFHYWTMARNRLILERVKTLPGPFLDVGCGRGVVVDYLRHHGVDCRGVELAPVENVSPHLREYIRTNTAASDLPEDQRLRVRTIILGDVLEHLPDPQEFLKALMKAFTNLQAFIITVPARQELWSNYDDHYGHFRRYDSTSLRKCVEGVGLRTVSLQYSFRFLYLPAWMLLGLKGKRPVKVAAPGPTMRLLHRLLSWIAIADARLLPPSIAGTSLIITARL
jgi:hypothetical protein